MGKSKNTKTNVNKIKDNIFKVAGSKSLKAKNKAKEVTCSRSKSTQLKNRQKVEDIDKQLSVLRTEVRQSTAKPKTTDDAVPKESNRLSQMEEEIRRYNEAEFNYENALGRLDSMDMR